MKLIIASNNRHKIEEIKAMLGAKFGQVLGMAEAGLDIDVDEDRPTLQGNARKKAEEIFAAADSLGLLSPGDGVLADDTERVEVDVVRQQGVAGLGANLPSWNGHPSPQLGRGDLPEVICMCTCRWSCSSYRIYPA